MSFFKKIGKGLKKVAKIALPIAGLAAPFIPGIGGAIGGLAAKVGGMFGGGSSSAAPPPNEMDGFAGYDSSVGQASSAPDWANVLINGVGRAAGGVTQSSWFPSAVGALGSGAAALWGGREQNAANAEQAQKQMDFQAAQNQKQMDFSSGQAAQQMAFQERMSSTAYQRQAADMKAAGYNPMLGYSAGGASSPGGAMGSGSSGGGASAQMGNEVGQAVSSALQASQAIQSLEAMRAGTERTRAETLNAVAQYGVIQEQQGLTNSQAKLNRWNAARAEAQLLGDIAESDVKERTADSRVRGLKAESSLSELAVPAAEKASKFADSPFGWLGPLLSTARQASQAASPFMR